MRSLAALLILGALALPAAAHPEGAGPRAAIREACKADAETLCRGIQPGEGRIRACFHANRDRLSSGCRNAIAAAIDARAARIAARAEKWRSPPNRRRPRRIRKAPSPRLWGYRPAFAN